MIGVDIAEAPASFIEAGGIFNQADINSDADVSGLFGTIGKVDVLAMPRS